MNTGYEGTFVIGWAQTTVDGAENAPLSALITGSKWHWSGDALRVDGTRDLALLQDAGGEIDSRRRAAAFVYRLTGAATLGADMLDPLADEDPKLNVGFEITDGYDSYRVSLIMPPNGGCPLLVFAGAMPQAGTTLRVIRANVMASQEDPLTELPSGVALLAKGTRVRTPSGDCPVEKLREGSVILTRAHGGQPVFWIGKCETAPGQTMVEPDAKPIRLRAGAIRSGQPDADLLVSPHQQILVSGKRARQLIGQNEVLASASDLVDGSLISSDRKAADIPFYQVLLGRHEVIWANGVPVESQHPVFADLDGTKAEDRARLQELFPQLDDMVTRAALGLQENNGKSAHIGVA